MGVHLITVCDKCGMSILSPTIRSETDGLLAGVLVSAAAARGGKQISCETCQGVSVVDQASRDAATAMAEKHLAAVKALPQLKAFDA